MFNKLGILFNKSMRLVIEPKAVIWHTSILSIGLHEYTCHEVRFLSDAMVLGHPSSENQFPHGL